MQNNDFLKFVIDSLEEQISVINESGDIIFINEAWINFWKINYNNDPIDWLNKNYLNVCDRSASCGDRYGKEAADGIRLVINGNIETFFFEYPCQLGSVEEWFMMRIAHTNYQNKKGKNYFKSLFRFRIAL
jgi:hypothetical protein